LILRTAHPQDILATIDHHRKVFDTDFVDSMLMHCMVKEGWTDEWKRIMDGFDEAIQRINGALAEGGKIRP